MPRPGMVRRSLYKAFVLAAGRNAGGFSHSSPFFLERLAALLAHRSQYAASLGAGVPHRPHKPAARRAAYCSRSLSRLATRHGSHTVPPSMGGCVPQRVHVVRIPPCPIAPPAPVTCRRAAPFRVSAAVKNAGRLGLRASCALGLAPFFRRNAGTRSDRARASPCRTVDTCRGRGVRWCGGGSVHGRTRGRARGFCKPLAVSFRVCSPDEGGPADLWQSGHPWGQAV